MFVSITVPHSAFPLFDRVVHHQVAAQHTYLLRAVISKALLGFYINTERLFIGHMCESRKKMEDGSELAEGKAVSRQNKAASWQKGRRRASRMRRRAGRIKRRAGRSEGGELAERKAASRQNEAAS